MPATLTKYEPPEGDWDYWPIVGPRGSGKTYTALQTLAELLGSQECGLVVAPQQHLLRWLLDEFAHQPLVTSVSRSNLSAKTSKSGLILFHTAEQVLRKHWLRGRRFDALVMDSIDLFPEQAERIAGEARVSALREPGARIITTAWGMS